MVKHDPFKLTNEIIALSSSKNWEQAKLEWVLSEIYEVVIPETCLCGHHPIKEICVIQNKSNGKKAIVGNVCVKKFLGLPSDRIFAAIKRISKDKTKSLNRDTIEFMRNQGMLNAKDYKFYNNTLNKIKLTEPQMQWRIDINNRILMNVNKRMSNQGDNGIH